MNRLIRALLVCAVLAVVCVPPAATQSTPRYTQQTTLCRNQDITTAGFTYFVYGDFNPAIAGLPVDGVWTDGRTPRGGGFNAQSAKATTSGSNTTVTSAVASSGVFNLNVVDDLLIFPRVVIPVAPSGFRNDYPQRFERKISAKASADSITVDEAIDLSNTATSGFDFRFKKLLSGTGTTDGWFAVRELDNFNIQFDVTTINATSLTATVECKTTPYAAANTIYTNVFSATGTSSIAVSVSYDQCRIGWKIAGDSGVQSVTTAVMGVR